MLTNPQIEKAIMMLNERIDSMNHMAERQDRRIEILEGRLADYFGDAPTAIGPKNIRDYQDTASVGVAAQGYQR